MKFVAFQICGIILLFIILGLSNKSKSIRLSSSNAYFFSLYSSLFCLTLDVTSVFFIVNKEFIPIYFVNFICKCYLISLVVVGYSGFNYLMVDLYRKQEQKTLFNVSTALLMLYIISIIIAKIDIFYDGDKLYTYNNAVNITYFGALSFIILTISSIFIFSKQLNRKRRKAILLWMFIWTISALIQLAHNELLLVGFTTAIGLLIVFSELENPSAYINKETGLFNSEMLRLLISEKLYSRESFYGFSFILEYNAIDFSIESEKEFTIALTDFLSILPNTLVFNNEKNVYTLYVKDDDTLNSVFERVNNYIQFVLREKEPSISVSYIVLEDYSVIKSLNDAVNLYQFAKLNNRKKDNITMVDEALVDSLRERENIKQDILLALNKNRIVTFYQPIYDTRTKTFTSAEALVRMIDIDGNIVSPSKFIPIAEESGLIIEIGERVFSNVCEFLNNHDTERLGVKYIEVNLSVLQCEQYNLFNKFRSIMKENNVTSEQINLEITETLQLNPSYASKKNIKDFNSSGISFSLDDFGTGSSNLNYITSMPVSIIKFDYTMTQNYFKNHKTKVIFEHIIPMAKNLNLEIVCEGIETEEQFNVMCDFGIEHIQGYYFSKPLSENNYIEFLEKYNVQNNKA